MIRDKEVNRSATQRVLIQGVHGWNCEVVPTGAPGRPGWLHRQGEHLPESGRVSRRPHISPRLGCYGYRYSRRPKCKEQGGKRR